jgi:hypothetical protein
LTWNVEGFSRNALNLLKILQDEDPSFIFITEPWLHLPDAPLALKEYLHQYNFFLNSEDRHDDFLSLTKSRAHGGTLALWKKEFDPYITVHEPTSSHILAIILEKPGYQTSIHITVYLSTAGKDAEFMKDLVLLQNTIDHLGDKFPDSLIFVRGDANASIIQRKNNKRDDLFRYFVEENKFTPLLLGHKTYHHFMNNGLSDSNIDVVMFPKVTSDGLLSSTTESLQKILCGKTNALVDSSHDVIITSLLLPPQPQLDISPGNMLAPRVEHTKYKVHWSEEGILEYQNLLSQTLPSLQSDYCDVSEPEVASVLFQVTNHILTEAARRTNKCIELGKAPKAKKPFIPSEIREAIKIKDDALTKLNHTDANTHAMEKEAATNEFKAAKAAHQKLVRKHNVSKEVDRDNNLLTLLSKQPKEIFKSFRNAKSDQAAKVKTLHVGNNTYTEENVADGFYESISKLKTISEITATSFERFSEDHRHIVEICKSGAKIPDITVAQAEALLRKIRPGVSDIFSISAAHYLNGGETSIKHFQFLFNTVLRNIELSSIDELNTVHAVILHKGHKKDKSLASSYRTISSCPFIAKAVDIYLGELSREDWDACQASTQFQGSGMSHELASLLLTTAIQNSLSSSEPLFVLLLDAKSAFDLVLREILVRRLYLDTTPDQRIRYWDLRLANRTTFCQWENSTMGPIHDELGVEQGGTRSSDHYKIYNNEQLTTAQESGFGTAISGIAVASVGQADDTALLSNDILQLQHLLNLSLNYCKKHQVQLSPGKTKLLVFSRHDTDYVKYVKLLSPLHMGDVPIEFVDTAEHVGVLRAVSGNLPHVHQRIVSHRGSLAKILSMGMSRRHRANPIAALRAENIFATPILFSGMASLFITKAESDILALHVKETTENLLKLHSKTPDPVVFFLAGRLPGEALLHLKQLTLFGMICHLPGNILHTIAVQLLTTSSQSSKNWFADIRTHCYTYNLPHPLLLLKNPLSKEAFRNLVKSNITDYWQTKLRAHSATLEEKSLKFFKPQFMSLSHPHPMWSTAVTSYKVNKCVVVARMLSGRFRCGSLLRHFSQHISGLCELCGIELEDMPHILLPRCPHLQDRAGVLLRFAKETLSSSPKASQIFKNITDSKDDTKFVQFLLDPSVVPEIIAASQSDPELLPLLFSVTTTWCYSINRTRTKLLGM